MKHRLALAVAIALASATAPALAQTSTQAPAAMNKEAVNNQANPLFADSPLPLHYPQFDKITDSDFAPAFDRGMAEHLQEINAIANARSAPTFENTIVPMEKSGQLLTRASLVSAPLRFWKIVFARVSSWPDFSIGTIVFSKVGAERELAIALISCICSAMPRSKAGAKSLSLILSNCG
jgi:hypothetical protein